MYIIDTYLLFITRFIFFIVHSFIYRLHEDLEHQYSYLANYYINNIIIIQNWEKSKSQYIYHYSFISFPQSLPHSGSYCSLFILVALIYWIIFQFLFIVFFFVLRLQKLQIPSYTEFHCSRPTTEERRGESKLPKIKSVSILFWSRTYQLYSHVIIRFLTSASLFMMLVSLCGCLRMKNVDLHFLFVPSWWRPCILTCKDTLTAITFH